MKTLTESLFDDKLVEKDLLEDPEFKAWINRPDVLWYLEAYWADDMEDPLEDFFPDEWAKYKTQVDYVLEKINQKSGNMWPLYKIDYGASENFQEIEDAFDYSENYAENFDAAVYEIKHKSTEETDEVWKTWFKGSMPKNSNVTIFMSQLPDEGSRLTRPGALAGGIFLTNEDTLMVWGFPRTIDKDILKLFNIK